MTVQNERIELNECSERLKVWCGDVLLADTGRALRLDEKGYPPRHYVPREDVRMDRLQRSATVTHCPHKGDATYYSLGEQADIAWSYEAPIAAMQAIAGALCFSEVCTAIDDP